MTSPNCTTEATPFDDGVLYDLLFENFDYGLDYYLDLARRADGPVLDVACGTGRVLIPCLQAGINTDGLDLSPQLLARLREKAEGLGFSPNLFHGDMRNFDLGKRYGLIMIAFNAFVHCLTTDEQLAALERLHAHLKPGGVLAFDTFFPGPSFFEVPNGTRVLELEGVNPKTGLSFRVFDTRTFDRVEQIQRSLMEIEELDDRGEIAVSHPSRTTVRWIFKQEMDLLLRLSGFSSWEILGGFDRRPLTLETDAMIVEARRRA